MIGFTLTERGTKDRTFVRALSDPRFRLAVGFGALALGICSALYAPARTYELSIYTSTPLLFWVGVVVALVTAVSVGFDTIDTPMRNFAILLGGMCIVAVYDLPLIRGFYFYGSADSLTHMGITESLVRGTIGPTKVVYPLLHTLTIVIHYATGESLRQSILFAASIFLLVFLSGVPLVIRAITADRWYLTIGVFSAMCVLPINLIGMYPFPFPTTQAVLYLPIILYLLLKAWKTGQLGFKLALFVTYLGLILLHPQQALSFILFVASAIVLKRATARVFVEDIYRKKWLLSSFCLAGVVTLVMWIVSTTEFKWALRSLVRKLLSSNNATLVSKKTGAISGSGQNVVAFFFILFGVSLVYISLSSIYFLLTYGKYRQGLLPSSATGDFSKEEVHSLLFLALFPVLSLTGVYMLSGDLSNQMFRYLGFSMMVLTITGAIALGKLVPVLTSRVNLRPSVVVKPLLVVFLLISVMTIHPSPFVFQGSEQVTESRVAGYEFAFAHQERGVYMMETQTPVFRYINFVYGVHRSGVGTIIKTARYNSVDDHYANDSIHDRSTPTYLTLTCYDRRIYTRLYHGRHFSAADFKYINNHPGIDKPMTTGCFELYRLSGRK